jgi:hypothetical protein
MLIVLRTRAAVEVLCNSLSVKKLSFKCLLRQVRMTGGTISNDQKSRSGVLYPHLESSRFEDS